MLSKKMMLEKLHNSLEEKNLTRLLEINAFTKNGILTQSGIELYELVVKTLKERDNK